MAKVDPAIDFSEPQIVAFYIAKASSVHIEPR
jgi:hypothetical protein